MKTRIKASRKSMAILVSLLGVCFMTLPTLQAQTVLPNVQINSASYFNMSIDGSAKTIAIVNDSVYAVWIGNPIESTSNIYFSKSINKGETFATEVNVFDGPATSLHALPSLAVNQNKNIYVIWTAITNDENDWNIWFAKSIDYGATFETPIHVTTNNGSVFSCIGTFNDNIYIFYADAINYPMANYYFVRSTNNGDSFDAPIQINDAPCIGEVEFDGLTAITIDETGNIYLAWVDGRREDGHGDIFFAKSIDSGQSFSDNIMVNDVSNLLVADSVQYLPSIAVDNSDNIYISFTDKRLGSDWQLSRAYIAKSSNGGDSFETETLLAGNNEVCISHDIATNLSGKLSAAICTHISPSWAVWLYESTNGGDDFSTPVALSDNFNYEYSDVRIVLNPEGEVYSMWKDNREGSTNIYFTRTDIETNILEIGQNDDYAIYPNPTNGSIFISFPSNDSNSEITVYDLQGQVIYKKDHSNVSQINIDLDIPQGIYFVNIKSNNGTKTMKLIKN